jgi:hypothetical protein
MTKKTSKDYREGSVKNRTQAQDTNPGNKTNHDNGCGQFMDAKADGKPFKGATREPSVADKKMMRAWDTISENRNSARRKH